MHSHQKSSFIFAMILCLSMVMPVVVLAQPNTVVVEPGVGTLNDAVAANQNSDTILQLRRGGRYTLNGRLKNDGFTLHIEGEADDPNNPLPPATIWPITKSDGTSDNPLIEMKGDGIFKNIAFLGMNSQLVRMANAIKVQADSVRLVVDNCLFEHFRNRAIRAKSNGIDVFLTNNIFRNILDKTRNWYNAGALSLDHLPADTVWYENNTFVNVQSFVFQVRFNVVNHVHWNHNTVVNNSKNTFHFEQWTDGVVTNNLFINTQFSGDSDSERSGQDLDGLARGSWMIDTLDVALGIPEASRKVLLGNNNWYLDPKFIDFYATNDTVQAQPFFNETAAAFFADNVNYPDVIEQNNTQIDPQFTTPPDNIDAIIAWSTERRMNPVPNEVTEWAWDPDGDPLTIGWPLSEDLSYASSSPLYTAGSDGFPLGDLNWFPDKKAEFVTSVETETPSSIPSAFELSQNYPNPFNPETSIQYALKKNGHVTLTVFNVLGQKFATLVDQKQQAGQHSVHWDGRDQRGELAPSGVYFYKLALDGFQSQTRKMVLMK